MSSSTIQPDTERFPKGIDNYQVSPDNKHFLQERKWRNMRDEWFQDVFENGELEPAGGDRHKFVLEIPDNYGEPREWCWIVEYNPDGPNEVVTGYCPELGERAEDKSEEKRLYDKYY